jgi:hypothetical protein
MNRSAKGDYMKLSFKSAFVFLALVSAFVLPLGSQSMNSNVVEIQLTATVPESVTVTCNPTSWPLTDGPVTINCVADFNTQQGRFTKDVFLVNADNSTPRSVMTPVIDGINW